MNFQYRLQAIRDLVGRYFSVLIHFWGERDKLGGNVFTEEEAKYLPAALSLQEMPVSPTVVLTGRVLITIIVVLLVWSTLGKMDIVVNASGKIIPSDYSKTVASVETAVVRALHVKEGQFVEAGEVLVVLDSSASDSEQDKAQATVIDARLQIARSKAIIAGVRNNRTPALTGVKDLNAAKHIQAVSQLESQYQDYLTKRVRLDDSIGNLLHSLELATRYSHDYRRLADTKDVSLHAWQEKEQRRVDIEGQLNDAINQRNVLVATTLREANEAITEASKVLQSSIQDEKRSGTRSRLLSLIAPTRGTVQQLSIHTVGGVVAAAQPLMKIVPKDVPVEIEALLENRDIGFLREGQSVEVKVDAYDYTRYGTIAAKLVNVSRDAIEDEKRGPLYKIKVALSERTLNTEIGSVELSAGMVVNVEMKTGERRIISYLLSPLLQHSREALNER